MIFSFSPHILRTSHNSSSACLYVCVSLCVCGRLSVSVCECCLCVAVCLGVGVCVSVCLSGSVSVCEALCGCVCEVVRGLIHLAAVSPSQGTGGTPSNTGLVHLHVPHKI